MVSSAKGLKLGSWGFCRSQIQTQNKCIHDLHFTHMFIFTLRPQQNAGDIHTWQYFDYGRNLKTPSPNFRMKVTQVLRLSLLYICNTTFFSGGKQARENIFGEDQPEVNLCRKALILATNCDQENPDPSIIGDGSNVTQRSLCVNH